MAEILEFPQKRIKTIAEVKASKLWVELTQLMVHWFSDPDLEAWASVLSIAVSHYFKRDNPIWLMLLGPAGTMKTTLLNMVEALDEAYELDNLTPQTLLSGFQRGNSLLHRIGREGQRDAIMLMPDFSTIISMRDGPRQEIASQFRKLYDGKITRPVGTGITLEWTGKITMIVAATPAAERHWGMMRDLGERFMQIRWARGDGIEQARFAHQQIGHEQDIMEKLRQLTRAFVDAPEMGRLIREGKLCQTPMEVIENGIAPFANAIAILRGHVVREHDWKREIIEVPEPEGPTRIMKAMSQIARAHAAMFKRPEIEGPDLRIARRLGLDTVPPARRLLLYKVLGAGADGIGWANLVRATGLPPTSVSRHAEEMEALGILRVEEKVEKTYALAEKFEELLAKAAPMVNI